VARLWSIAFIPIAAPLAHGSAGVWDEVFNLIAVGVVLVVLGVIVFSRKSASSEEPEDTEAGRRPEEDQPRPGLNPRKPK